MHFRPRFRCLLLALILLWTTFCPIASSRLKPCFAGNRHWVELEDEDELNFLALGDWGVVGSNKSDVDEHVVQQLAATMDSRARWDNSKFALNVGDSFYQSGVNSVSDDRWQRSFEQVFNGSALTRMYWYGVLGNHDYRGSVQAQFDYTAAAYPLNPHGRWCLPNFYYTFAYRLRSFSVRFIAIDTMSLVHVCNDGCQRTTAGHCCTKGKCRPRRKGGCSHHSRPAFQKMLDWLQDTLANASEDYTIVFAHHPTISLGFHGTQYHTERTPRYTPSKLADRLNGTEAGELWGLPALRNELRSVLVGNNVDLYIAGHDHITQRYVHSENGMKEIGVGCFGKMDGRVYGNQDTLNTYFNDVEFQGAEKNPAFASVHITPGGMSVELIGADWMPPSATFHRFNIIPMIFIVIAIGGIVVFTMRMLHGRRERNVTDTLLPVHLPTNGHRRSISDTHRRHVTYG